MKTKKQQKPHKNQNHTKRFQQLREHFKELTSRTLWLGGTFLIASVLGFEFLHLIQGTITSALVDFKLVNYVEAQDIGTVATISFYIGALLTIPFVFYHVFRFLEPLFNEGTAYISKIFVASSLLAIAGVAYGTFVTIPYYVQHTLFFGANTLEIGFTEASYISFVTSHTLGLAVLFQLPLVVMFIHKVKPLQKSTLLWSQRLALFVIVLIAGATTPHMDFNQMMILLAMTAVPALIIYQIGFIVALRSRKAPTSYAQTTPVASENKKQFSNKLTIAEDEVLESFPDTVFDSMLEDGFENEKQPEVVEAVEEVESTRELAPLPLAAAVDSEPVPEPVVEKVATSAPRPFVKPPMVHAVKTKPLYRPAPHYAVPAPSPVRRAPILAPKPLMQPQQVATPKLTTRPQPILDTVRVAAKVPTPVVSGTHPRAAAPFRMYASRPRQGTMEGFISYNPSHA